MNQQSQGQPGQQGAAQQNAGQAPHGTGSSGRPEAHSAAPTFMKQQGVRNEAVAGPFTVRDLTVFAATLVLFVASLIPMFAVRYNLWNLGSLFFLGLGVVLPLIVAALFAARRLAPDTKVRIGSLSVDQFGSVVASFAVGFFFLSVAGAYTPSLLVALIGSLVLLAATVLARYIPFFAGDFLDRAEVPAHIMARDSAVPVRKPKAPKEPKPAAAAPGASSAGASGGAASAGVLSGSAAGASAASPSPESRGPVSHGSASHGATAVGQPGRGAAQTGAAGPGTVGAAAAGAAGAGAGAAGAAPATGIWPAANAASSAAAPPETGPAAVVPSAQTSGAAQASTVPSAKADAAGAQPVTPEAEQTQLDAGTAAPVAGADSAGRDAAGTEAPAAEAPVAESTSDAAAREVAEEGARAASATPATAVHPRVDIPQQARSQEPIGATVDPASRPEESEQEQVHEAFWFAVAQHRTAVDERTGAPLFGIEPGGWVLALEDRGDEFLVQHTDGRVGVLRDLSNIERG